MRMFCIALFFFSYGLLANPIGVKLLGDELSRTIGCDKNDLATFCLDSVSQFNDDYLVKIRVATYSHLEFSKDKHALYFIEEANKYYSMFNRRVARFLKNPMEIEGVNYNKLAELEDKIIAVYMFDFSNVDYMFVRDTNDTAYVSYSPGEELEEVITENRKSIGERATQSFNPKNEYETLVRDIYTIEVREVIERDVRFPDPNDLTTYEFIGEERSAGEYVKTREITAHQALYFNVNH